MMCAKIKYYLSCITLIIVVASVSLANASKYDEVILASPRNDPGRAREDAFQSLVDHFFTTAPAFFHVRYAVNDDFAEDGGPIIIYIGAHETLNFNWINEGLAHDIAQELGGTLFSIEQRFFGATRPVYNLEWDNLEHLTVKQYIRDIYIFILHIRTYFPLLSQSKILLFGNGFGASVAVWFHQSYPDLVNGVWASSAPLQVNLAFHQFHETVGDLIIEFGSESCYNRILYGFEEIKQIFVENDFAGIAALQDDFYLCNPVEGRMAAEHFSFNLASIISMVTSIGSSVLIQDVCTGLQTGQSDYKALVDLANDFRGILAGGGCYDWTYASLIQSLGAIEWTPNERFDGRQAQYKRCTEIGSFATSSPNDPFANTIPIEYFIAQCADVFNRTFEKDEMLAAIDDEFNAENGGLLPNVRNVLFTTGAINNWRQASVLTDLNESSPAIFINNNGASEELKSIEDYDNEDLSVAKERIRDTIIEWLMGPEQAYLYKISISNDIYS